MALANRTHGTIQGELAWLIASHLHSRHSRCNLVVEPGLVPRAKSSHNVRVLDLAMTSTQYTQEEAALSDPVLLIDIPSPHNEPKTWQNVWAYRTIPSAREILEVGSPTYPRDKKLHEEVGNRQLGCQSAKVLNLILLRCSLGRLNRKGQFLG